MHTIGSLFEESRTFLFLFSLLGFTDLYGLLDLNMLPQQSVTFFFSPFFFFFFFWWYLGNKGEVIVVMWKTWPLNYHTVLGIMS